MQRMTTDNPFDTLDVLCNMVYPKDGWTWIRHPTMEGMPITDFCIQLCALNNCQGVIDTDDTEENKDDLLCACMADGCPIASVYAALSGFSHVRSRLKMYEDTGRMPDDIEMDGDQHDSC